MRVATLCGSLHSRSTNAVVLATIADHLQRPVAMVDSIDVSAEVPAFRPETIGDHQVGDTLVAVLCGDEDAATASAAALTPLGIDPSDRLS